MKQRVIVYIDGFNFYYGLKHKKWKQFYWLDIVKFFEKFAKPYQEITQVHYFSAIPHDLDKQDRQDLFFLANKLNPKFNLQLGKFLKKNIKCFECGNQYKSYEEKETDVRIATQMIRDVVQEKCDSSILVSADSDLIPPIEFIREYKPSHKIYAYFPPKRFSFDLSNKAEKFIKLERHHDKFQDSVLSERVTLENGFVIERPDSWK